ncbi:nickel pincer cofactor biosynthesis protein LarB [Candidatus Oleimmundimicrobium sp.]|uniref:nickel pincer cofactor biosynthesis protein LarB n=1 Tax=Candidatus Oleimmundimicrobium sp. TaxID=3060597 RepID=UPI002722A764|nr:nickel pincer cofactor biosynthesis protein LarB [Candidatus Oleimmundimicrobium sp.]MDO8886820.1 nickel pincer cofactor biosynthesis protein LarB [Candidatus Oleimmundimicrobium sp.]
MDSGIKDLIEKVKKGEVGVDEAMENLRNLPFEDLGFAKVDHHRPLRTGFPEVIFCSGKTPNEISKIVKSLKKSKVNILATKANEQIFKTIEKVAPKARYYPEAKIVVIEEKKAPQIGQILVITAGTSDIRVAEEAAITAEMMGSKVERLYDVGVAGIHRLLAYSEKLRAARVIIAVAGMEGALPSVVGGLVSCPVIAVPTNIGYGASFGGLAALLTMMNSCAPGVAVVNIDNGFGAGHIATLINQLGE